jgi:hypothetical protein
MLALYDSVVGNTVAVPTGRCDDDKTDSLATETPLACRMHCKHRSYYNIVVNPNYHCADDRHYCASCCMTLRNQIIVAMRLVSH